MRLRTLPRLLTYLLIVTFIVHEVQERGPWYAVKSLFKVYTKMLSVRMVMQTAKNPEYVIRCTTVGEVTKLIGV